MESRKEESLASYVKRVRADKGLSTTDVERQSKQGGAKGISDAYVTRIENGYVTNVSPAKLSALARGLQISEDELFAVARGKPLNGEEIIEGEFAVLFNGFHKLSEKDKQEVLVTVRMLAADVQRRARKGKSTGKK